VTQDLAPGSRRPGSGAAIAARFSEIGVAQIADAAGSVISVLDLPLRRRTAATHICGPAFPVQTNDDMLPCLQALAAAPAGSVLYIANIAERSEALIGDLFAEAAQAQGLAGIVVDGAARDLADIGPMNFPIFSTSVTFVSARTTDLPCDTIPQPVRSGGVLIGPGDWIFGDPDGFCVVPTSRVDAALMGAAVLRNHELKLKERLRGGDRLDVLTGLDKFLAGTGDLGFVP
jgi:4-hydroxy-4-methyl-2-oxoglutarate aldolase